jgi:hypothetical protein
MVREIPEHQLREIKVKLPEDLVEWLGEIAEARGETIDDVLTWTLGILRNFYDRWFLPQLWRSKYGTPSESRKKSVKMYV